MKNKENDMVRILFVCLGNICRSPMAEFVMKDMVKKKGTSDKFYIASAGTSDEEITSGNKSLTELLKHLVLCFLCEVDKNVTANDKMAVLRIRITQKICLLKGNS